MAEADTAKERRTLTILLLAQYCCAICFGFGALFMELKDERHLRSVLEVLAPTLGLGMGVYVLGQAAMWIALRRPR